MERRRRYRRRRNPAGATIAKFGLGVLGGLITKGFRYLSQQLPFGKAGQDITFVAATLLGAWGAAYVSEPIMIGLGGGLGVEGANIAQFWYVTLSTPATTDKSSTSSSSSSSSSSGGTGTGSGAIASGLGAISGNVRQIHRKRVLSPEGGVASRKSSFG